MIPVTRAKYVIVSHLKNLCNKIKVSKYCLLNGFSKTICHVHQFTKRKTVVKAFFLNSTWRTFEEHQITRKNDKLKPETHIHLLARITIKFKKVYTFCQNK